MSLGVRIRQLRQSRGLTQQQLGGPELSKSFISLVERDRTRPSVSTLMLLARRLGTSVDALLGQEGHLPESAAAGLLGLSAEAGRKRDYTDAARLLDAAKFIADKHRLPEATLEIKLQQVQFAIEQDAVDEAWATLQLVRELAEGQGDQWRLGRALVLMGRVWIRRRDYAQAASVLERAVAVLKKAHAGRDPARVHALIHLGTSLTWADRPEEALRRYTEAASSDAASRDPQLRGRALWGIGWIHRRRGQLEAARASLLQAKDALEAAEELPDLARVLHNLGQLEYQRGRSEEALRHLHHALRVMDRLGQSVDRAATLTEIGRVHLSLGSLEEADHFARTAIEQAEQVGDPVEAAEATLLLGRVELARGAVKAAVKHINEALAVFRQRNMKSKTVEVSREFGLALKARGAHAEAAEFLAQVVEGAKVENPTMPA